MLYLKQILFINCLYFLYWQFRNVLYNKSIQLNEGGRSSNIQSIIEGGMTMSQNRISYDKIFNLLSIIGLLGTVILCIYGYMTGIITSFERLHIFIEQSGIWGPLLFILIQIIQVVIPILPGGISCAYGVLLFGPEYGFIYNYVGIVIGSVIAFLIARQLGKPFIRKIIPTRTYQKYITWLDKGRWFDRLFALGIFLPGAPDDFLCMLAGITKMKLKKFILLLVLCKPGALYIYSIGLSTFISWIAW